MTNENQDNVEEQPEVQEPVEPVFETPGEFYWIRSG